MLHQELPAIAARPLDGGCRWLVPALVGAAFLSLGRDLAAVRVAVTASFLPDLPSQAWLAGGRDALTGEPPKPLRSALGAGPDYGLVGAALALVRGAGGDHIDRTARCWPPTRPIAMRFDAVPPLKLPADGKIERSRC